ncbi:hypothetical protein ACH5RR_035647 [Cinchona calisaya]|uniref:Ubiquitin-like protease family profile domain-containing protein n=1 Tax=Cinchona calisaya TaxID=153742 RepID=A0ABD2Y6E0_9GENT
MAGEGRKRKGPIELDWEKLLGKEEESPELVVVAAAAGKSPQSPETEWMDGEDHTDQLYELRTLSNKSLQETVARMKRQFPSLSANLKDRGDKYKVNLKRHEDELERRRLLRLQKNDDDGCNKPIELQNQNCTGVSDNVQHRAPTSGRSVFGSCFLNKLKGKTDRRTANAFEKELSTLNRCDHRKMQSNSQFLSGGTQKRGLSSRESPFQSPSCPLNVDNEPESNGYQKDRKSSPRVQTSNRLKRVKGETVVLVDEEEIEIEKTTTKRNELGECKNTKIYYPSRNDPVSVEICYSDMDCLAPEKYLSSTIMNFYIRYLQVEGITLKTTDGESYNYHFFNTYFYEKLKEAVVKKKIGETSFAKFRRWWKGVNIFEKAYIFLPIHENLHWSLVIICIPDVEDRSGPILLHLDSLRLHSSKQIFGNIKSFLIEEWNFLKEAKAPLNLPIADSILENLSRRIDEKIIEVPQQSNDYDCGLFVLFFMKRFIEEAPKRLKKKDLAMFGRHWFNPQEASSLRGSIRRLLKEKFKNASEEKQILEL